MTKKKDPAVQVVSSLSSQEATTVTAPLDTPLNVRSQLGLAFVEVEKGGTFNLGNYNNARVYVRVSIPCEPNEQAINDALQLVDRLAEAKVSVEIDRLEGVVERMIETRTAQSRNSREFREGSEESSDQGATTF